jgi:hypothetical protein
MMPRATQILLLTAFQILEICVNFTCDQCSFTSSCFDANRTDILSGCIADTLFDLFACDVVIASKLNIKKLGLYFWYLLKKGFLCFDGICLPALLIKPQVLSQPVRF